MTTTQAWQIGDTYFQAIIEHAAGCGCEAGPERRQRSEAVADLANMAHEFGGSSSAEYVSEMVVTELDADGSIGSSCSPDMA